MKTQITLLFIVFGLFNGFAQPNIDTLLVDKHMSQQFLSVKLETNTSLGKSYYAIIPPVFETYYDTIFKAREDIPVPANMKLTSHYLELKPAVFNFKQLTIDDEEAVLYLYEQDLLAYEFLLLVKELVTSDYMTYKQFENNDFNETIIVQKQRLISKSSIQKLTSKDDVIHPKQTIFRLDNGKWSDFKINSFFQNTADNRIIEIQKALNKKGYSCPINGIFDSETKAAFNKVGKDINIPICCRIGCGYLIFRELGLSGY